MRKMSVAGSFYPANRDEIIKYFEYFTKSYDENFTLPNIKSKAVIVPHAGYIYSGFTANIAYRILAQNSVKNFIVIGPSHRVGFEGISICGDSSYETPLGTIESNLQMLENLSKQFNLSTLFRHQEHSTEVQFPFIKYYIKDANIIELVYSDASTSVIADIINYTLTMKEWGVIISTDLSHFYDQSRAQVLDRICMEAIQNKQIFKLHEGCEACGILGVEGMLKSALMMDLTPTILNYRTSADSSGDTGRVVGYLSACFS